MYIPKFTRVSTILHIAEEVSPQGIIKFALLSLSIIYLYVSLSLFLPPTLFSLSLFLPLRLSFSATLTSLLPLSRFPYNISSPTSSSPHLESTYIHRSAEPSYAALQCTFSRALPRLAHRILCPSVHVAFLSHFFLSFSFSLTLFLAMPLPVRTPTAFFISRPVHDVITLYPVFLIRLYTSSCSNPITARTRRSG